MSELLVNILNYSTDIFLIICLFLSPRDERIVRQLSKTFRIMLDQPTLKEKRVARGRLVEMAKIGSPSDKDKSVLDYIKVSNGRGNYSLYPTVADNKYIVSLAHPIFVNNLPLYYFDSLCHQYIIYTNTFSMKFVEMLDKNDLACYNIICGNIDTFYLCQLSIYVISFEVINKSIALVCNLDYNKLHLRNFSKCHVKVLVDSYSEEEFNRLVKLFEERQNQSLFGTSTKMLYYLYRKPLDDKDVLRIYIQV